MATHPSNPSNSPQASNLSNYPMPQPSSYPGQFPNVMFISQEDFVQWTSLWQETMCHGTTEASDLFLDTVDGTPDYLQQGVGFDSQNILAFLSTIGLYTVHVRFGIRITIDEKSGERYKHFKLILFGRDRKNNIVTPYMVGYPIYDKTTNLIKIIEKSSNNLGEVPVTLAKQWIQHWKDLGKTASTAMFTIPNATFEEPLQGYTYQMREFLNTLFMDETTNEVYAILGLHQYPALGYKYPPSGYTESIPQIETFGLLFLGIHNLLLDSNRKAPNQLSDRFVESDEVMATAGYYDFSAPCPGTC